MQGEEFAIALRPRTKLLTSLEPEEHHAACQVNLLFASALFVSFNVNILQCLHLYLNSVSFKIIQDARMNISYYTTVSMRQTKN